ncbi:hypothetical protein BD770DRAFT_397580 [Pilaira anomala]|nr:hypothetical protein BD770DRAFT_397580 [Pilaira anomala]
MDTEGYDDLMGPPARDINHEASLPKLTLAQVKAISKTCHLALSSMPLYQVPALLREALSNHVSDQQALRSLNKYQELLRILKKLLDDDVDEPTFPCTLWSFQAEARTWVEAERMLFSVVGIIMTDFWGLFKRHSFVQDHERTFWVEYIVPIFKHFSIINKEVLFSWCESVVSSHTHSQAIPGVWSNLSEKLFSDGVARTSGAEVIIMESSGSYSRENVEHSLGDTSKLVTLMTNSLRSEILRYQNASISTIANLAVFGVQCICDKITLMKTSLFDANKWQVVELRSATIPVTWDSKVDLLQVFELLATLQQEYDHRKDVLRKLRREMNNFDQVEAKDTVRSKFSNSNLLCNVNL